MSDKSSIEWTDATWNPTRGCTKIAQGCKHCYAETFAERFRGVKGHPYERGFDPRLAPDKLTEPLKWKKPRRIFVDSMSDLFHEAFSDEYIAAVFAVMAVCAYDQRGHVFQILTKRPGRAASWFKWIARDPRTLMHESLKGVLGYHHPERRAVNYSTWPLPNVWFGTSIAEQKDADANIPHLLQIPAAVHFLSVEPLIGPVNLTRIKVAPPKRNPWELVPVLGDVSEIDALRGQAVQGRVGFDLANKVRWVIVGGESGPGARPMHPDWVRSIRDQCIATGTPFFFKQWGEYAPGYATRSYPSSRIGCGDDPDGRTVMALPDGILTDTDWNGGPGSHLQDAIPMLRVGKKAAGRLLDGRVWDEFPVPVKATEDK